MKCFPLLKFWLMLSIPGASSSVSAVVVPVICTILILIMASFTVCVVIRKKRTIAERVEQLAKAADAFKIQTIDRFKSQINSERAPSNYEYYDDYYDVINNQAANISSTSNKEHPLIPNPFVANKASYDR